MSLSTRAGGRWGDSVATLVPAEAPRTPPLLFPSPARSRPLSRAVERDGHRPAAARRVIAAGMRLDRGSCGRGGHQQRDDRGQDGGASHLVILAAGTEWARQGDALDSSPRMFEKVLVANRG